MQTLCRSRMPFRSLRRASLSRHLSSASTTRDPRFRELTASHVSHFRSVLGARHVITDTEAVRPFNTDWMRRYEGRSQLVLQPGCTNDLSTVLSYCDAYSLAVVPQGGNTGLVGGSVPVHDEVVLSLTRMNGIDSFDESSGIVVCNAGVTLKALDDHVRPFGHTVPLDLAPRNTCTIGGNVATHAGGSRFVRHGPLRAAVIGVQAVLANGSVLDVLSGNPKDNSGYPLAHLLTGSEGTLAVLSKVALACPVRPAFSHAALIAIETFDGTVPSLVRLARSSLDRSLSALEFADTQSVRLATAYKPHVAAALPSEAEPPVTGGVLLVEAAGNDAAANRAAIHAFVDKARQQGFTSNTVLADDESHATRLWELRESLPAALLHAAGPDGITLKYDISIPVHRFYECAQVARKRLQGIPHCYVATWGHVGDGNIHLNVTCSDKAAAPGVVDRIEPWVYEFVQDCNGSISAEHGIGLMKSNAIGYSKSAVAIDMMRRIKEVFDPKGILNPYKVLPSHTT